MVARNLTTLFAALLIAACTPKTVTEQVKTWYQIQDSYAIAIAETEHLGRNTSIVAVKGFIFPIGTPLNAETSMARTVNCFVPEEATMSGPFASHPVITYKTTLSALATPQSDWIKIVADGKVDFEQTRYIEIAYSNMTFRMIPDTGLDPYYRGSPKCMQDIEGRTLSIVRGYIYAQLRVKSQDFDKRSADAKVRKVGYIEVKQNDHGDISIEDNENKARFAILSRSVISGKCPSCPIGVARLNQMEKARISAALAKLEPLLSPIRPLDSHTETVMITNAVQERFEMQVQTTSDDSSVKAQRENVPLYGMNPPGDRIHVENADFHSPSSRAIGRCSASNTGSICYRNY